MALETQAPVAERTSNTFYRVSERPGIRLIALIALFVIAPLLLLRTPFVADPDLGFHLRTGDWILQHGSVPRVESFSSYAMGKSWVAYSWLFEVILSLLFRWGQLVGVILYGVVMRLLIGVALWRMVSRVLPQFWAAWAVTVPAVVVISLINGPRPVLFSVLFVVLVVDALVAGQGTGWGNIWWLPAIFAVWANVHIQFVHGIVIIGAFALEATWRRIRQGDFGAKPLRLWSLMTACMAATLVNPYGVGVWKLVWTFLHQPKLYNLIIEMQAPDFREATEYIVLIMVIASGFALGRQRRLRPAWALLLIFAAEQGFRSRRELWFTAVIAAAIIANVAGEHLPRMERARMFPVRGYAAVALCTVALLGAGARFFNLNNDFLWMQMHGRFPEVAVRYIERNHLHGGIFNVYGWGGYLMWRLPEMPVAIDGRANNVHDQDHVQRVFDTWRAKPGWQNDPELNAADIVIGRADYPLTSLLRYDQRFRVAHEDREAVVFVKAQR